MSVVRDFISIVVKNHRVVSNNISEVKSGNEHSQRFHFNGKELKYNIVHSQRFNFKLAVEIHNYQNNICDCAHYPIYFTTIKMKSLTPVTTLFYLTTIKMKSL